MSIILILGAAAPVPVSIPEHPYPAGSVITHYQYTCDDGERTITLQGGQQVRNRIVRLAKNGIPAQAAVLDNLNRILAERFDAVRGLGPECHSRTDYLHVFGVKGRAAKNLVVTWSTTTSWPDADDPGLR